MVINDPKGELLVKFYVKGTVRGFQIVQFNLINAMKTDIYNPLGMAADAAREGDFTKCAMYVENIAEVFFPVDGGDDPVWPNAANNAFKRAAYGLIDYYLELEKSMRLEAVRAGTDPKVLEAKIDQEWGHVTLYNCYQLFVQLTAKKAKNPAVEFAKRAKAGDFNKLTDEEKAKGISEYTGPSALSCVPTSGRVPMSDAKYAAILDDSERESTIWEDKPEQDLLTLYFNATAMLPKNQMRVLISNADNALRAMAGAEKMLASCDLLCIEKICRQDSLPNCTAEARNEGVTPRNASSDLRHAYVWETRCVWSSLKSASCAPGVQKAVMASM